MSEDGSADVKKPDVEEGAALVKSDAPPPAPSPEEFNFFKLFNEVHGMVIRLNGYPIFLLKYLCVQCLRTCGVLSFIVLAYAAREELDLSRMSTLSNNMYGAFAGVTILIIFSQLSAPLTGYLVDTLKMQLQIAQATGVIAKIFVLEHNSMISTPTGEFAQLLTKVYMNVDKLLPALYGAIFPLLLEVITAVLFVGIVYGWVALVQLGLFLIYTSLAFGAAKGKARRNKAMMESFFVHWAEILVVAASYERAHFFDNVEREVKKAHDAFSIMGEQIVKVTVGEHRTKFVLLFVTLTVTGAWILCLPYLASYTTVIELAALAMYVFMFVAALGDYANAVSELRSALVEYRTLNEFVERRSGVGDVPNAIKLEPRKNPQIEFKNVTFSYGGRVILDDVSFVVKPGETLGLVGSSGCGKSTIMRLLLRFYRQSSGTILIDGHDTTKVNGRSLRQLFSVVTQDSQLFNATIRDNISYGKIGASDEEILHAATLAELKFDDDLNLDKVCGEKGAKLSGGQQQRVALARAMLKNGTVYLLDEPTTGLDGMVAKSLQATLDKLASNATTIMITHHLEDLRTASHILYLDKGRIIEQGTYESLFNSKGAFYEQIQARSKEKAKQPEASAA